MTPKFWYNAAKLIENIEPILVKIGLSSLALLFLSILYAIYKGDGPNILIFFSIIPLFAVCGLGLVRHNFKTLVEKEASSIEEYMEKAGKPQKFMMWYGSIFISFWLCGLAVFFVILCFKVIVN